MTLPSRWDHASERRATAIPDPVTDREESREALASLAQEQTALRRVATLVAQGTAPSAVFAAVAEEAGRLLGADIAAIDRFDSDDMVTLVAVTGTPDPAPAIGSQGPVARTGNAARVRATGRPSRIDRYTQQISPIGYQSGFRAAVSAPITVGGRLWGAMTVASTKEDEPFPRETEERLVDFTELAAMAIANAEAREELRSVADVQSALRRVATLVASGVGPASVFAAVSEEVSNLLSHIDFVLLGRYESNGSVEYVGGWNAAGDTAWVGTTVPVGGNNVTTKVFESEQPARVEHLADDAAATSVARRSGARSSAGAPIHVDGRLWGVIIVASSDEAGLQPRIEHDLAGFTELVAMAIANTQAREEVAVSRARIVAAGDEARRRIERDLHDGVQQRLVVLGLQLREARELADGSPTTRAQLAQIGQGLANVMEELREISSGIHPVVLRHGGLRAGIRALARRSPVPVEVEVPTDLDLPDPVEVAAYYVVSEAVTNAAKHAHASSMEIRVSLSERELELTIRDDGVGGATVGAGSGLIGLTDRVQAVGGGIEITSPQVGGTTLRVTLPLARVSTQPIGEPA